MALAMVDRVARAVAVVVKIQFGRGMPDDTVASSSSGRQNESISEQVAKSEGTNQ